MVKILAVWGERLKRIEVNDIKRYHVVGKYGKENVYQNNDTRRVQFTPAQLKNMIHNYKMDIVKMNKMQVKAPVSKAKKK